MHIITIQKGDLAKPNRSFHKEDWHKRIWLLAIGLLGAFLAGPAMAGNSKWFKVAEEVQQAVEDRPVQVRQDGVVEFGFSPNAGAEALVLKVIDSARSEIRVLAYSFTSASVTRALLNARHRGVDVAIAVDYKNNISQDKSGKARAALNALANAGCRVRTISVFAIQHEKTIVADKETVQSGSFNYSEAAASKNSENVVVIWRNVGLAKAYLAHFEARWARGEEYRASY